MKRNKDGSVTLSREDIQNMASSVQQGHTAEHILIAYCKICGKELFAVRPGDMYFTLERGKCDCSWHCCQFTDDPDHGEHILYRRETPQYAGELMKEYHFHRLCVSWMYTWKADQFDAYARTLSPAQWLAFGMDHEKVNAALCAYWRIADITTFMSQRMRNFKSGKGV